MKPLFARWLSVLLALCLLVSLAPAALMEEMPEAQVTVVEETMPTVDGEDQAEPAEEDSEIVAAPVSEYVEEEEMSLDDSAQEPSDSVIQDDSSAEPADAVQAVPFDQSVTIDDVVIRLFGEAGAFPEGTILRAEKITDEALIQDILTALAIEGEYIHNLYLIVAEDASGNMIMPNEDVALPRVSMESEVVTDGCLAAFYDSHTQEAYALAAEIEDNAIGFSFAGSAIYALRDS